MDHTSEKQSLHPVAKRLIVIRGLRSVGQGAMVVDLTLYLKDLHWSGAAIGGVVSAAGLFGAVLIVLVGVLSDRVGRRPFLFIYEGLTMLAALLTALTSASPILIGAIVFAGFGRGQSGAAGPFSPAEQAWLAKVISRPNRGRIFSFNNAAGFLGMALGSVVAGVPSLIHAAVPLVEFRPIFILVGVISLVCCVLIALTPETAADSEDGLSTPSTTQTDPSDAQNPKTSVAAADAYAVRRRENRAMLQLTLVNTLNGLAVGLTGPMMVYWFSIRFHAGSGVIGATLALGFLLTGAMSIFNGFLATKYGMVRSVTGMRIIGSSMMILLPAMQSFWVASVLYAVRTSINRGTQGNRSALSASIVGDKRRGFAISLNALSMRLPSAVGPTISGFLFDAGLINLPLFLTAGLQLVNAWLYQRVFGKYDREEAPSH